MAHNPLSVKTLDHIALHVSDLAASIRFYGETLGLPQIPRPAFDFDGAWFGLGEARELHLIVGRTETVNSFSRRTHFALEITDPEAAERHLTRMKATFNPPKLRPDGAIQIFVTDPDGYWIELCEKSGVQ
ncbi:glyoxalase [Emticicia sp. CRIBPO]|uniref:VOC family protein n=1 Tax=Emticicia sp. CRIBPO TaxID=2683258 RepID=UPI0014126320|nr:VOC family protein [Emticicia sp. CRIBPO]NBA86237.1 glyoxalase [Emticicia sp. CRIBPO]